MSASMLVALSAARLSCFCALRGVATYLKLFKEQKQAPRVLCVKRRGDDFGHNWTNFNDWNPPLGPAVSTSLRANGIVPEYFITDLEHDWPWSVPVHGFRTRGTSIGSSVVIIAARPAFVTFTFRANAVSVLCLRSRRAPAVLVDRRCPPLRSGRSSRRNLCRDE